MSIPTHIDHFVLLLSPKDFQTIPSWLADNFTVVDGGTHSRGTSHNKLILFEDGSYLELFSWVDPQPEGVDLHADFPSWASKPVNCVIDWALTGDDASDKHKEVMSSLEKLQAFGNSIDVTYDEPREGGRKRPDGQLLKWVTTRPRWTNSADSSAPATVPFFCHDVTNRTLRVPYTKGSTEQWPGIITHRCGATGIAGITINIPKAQYQEYTKLYESLLGRSASNETEDAGNVCFDIDAPGVKTRATDPRCVLQLRPSAQVSSSGIAELVIGTRKADWENSQLSPPDFGTQLRCVKQVY